MEIKVIILEIGEIQQVSEKFKKREFVVIDNSNPTYPVEIPMEFTQDKCSILDSFAPTQEVIVSFNIRGFKWQDKITLKDKRGLTLQAWKIS